MAVNTLSGLAANYDLVGPTVDDDVRRIIARWGADAVKEAVKAQTKPKRGRKPEKDWPQIWPYIERDAVEWLRGGDPFKRWSYYSIAKDYADHNPGHSHPATMKRVIGRLKRHREKFMLYEAQHKSRERYPYKSYLRAVEELVRVAGGPGNVAWLELHQKYIAEYEQKYGNLPPEGVSMAEVEAAAKRPLPKAKGSNYIGLLERYRKPDEAEG